MHIHMHMQCEAVHTCIAHATDRIGARRILSAAVAHPAAAPALVPADLGADVRKAHGTQRQVGHLRVARSESATFGQLATLGRGLGPARLGGSSRVRPGCVTQPGARRGGSPRQPEAARGSPRQPEAAPGGQCSEQSRHEGSSLTMP